MGQRPAVIPGTEASVAEAFAWYALNHWGTGPGKVLPDTAAPGWHAYSALDHASFDERLQLDSASEAGGTVTLVFVRSSRRLIVVVEPRAEEAPADVLGSLWRSLTPLTESEDAWRDTTTRISATTFVLHPAVWPGEL